MRLSAGVPTKPEVDETLIIEPPPDLRIAWIAALVPRNTPLAFTAITSSQILSVVSSTVSFRSIAALFIRMSSLPKACNSGIHHPTPIGLFGYVDPHKNRLPTAIVHILLDATSLILQQVAHHHAGPLAGEKASRGRADPPRATAYQGYLAFQSQLFLPQRMLVGRGQCYASSTGVDLTSAPPL